MVEDVLRVSEKAGVGVEALVDGVEVLADGLGEFFAKLAVFFGFLAFPCRGEVAPVSKLPAVSDVGVLGVGTGEVCPKIANALLPETIAVAHFMGNDKGFLERMECGFDVSFSRKWHINA